MALLRAAALAAVACVTAAQITFTADLSSPAAPFNPIVQKCFGSGHASLGLRQDWRQHLAAVKADIGLGELPGMRVDLVEFPILPFPLAPGLPVALSFMVCVVMCTPSPCQTTCASMACWMMT